MDPLDFPAQRAIQNLHLNIGSNHSIIDELISNPNHTLNNHFNSSHLSFNHYNNNTLIKNVNVSLFGIPNLRNPSKWY